MTRRMVILALAAGLVVGLAVSPPAGAHGDHTPDAPGSECDTVVRPGHEPGHHHTSSNDFDLGVAYVHDHGGHYAVTTDAGYVEVIGGQGYNEGGNQGGYVQGEVDPGVGADADFKVGLFAGQNPPYASPYACLSVADVKVGS